MNKTLVDENSPLKPPGSRVGQVLGNCHLEEKVGKGGMGVVYRAHHMGLDRPVAVKLLEANAQVRDDAVKRFIREARTAAKVRHENLVQIYDVASDPVPYMVMELLIGEDLGERIDRDGPLPIPLAIDLTLQACAGLGAAHQAGVIHRDLKPNNLFLGEDGTLKIMDFGLARLTQLEEEASKVTQTGQILGTPQYMSPEQCIGGELDQRSDIYGLGCTVYCLLTGRPPFNGQLTRVLMAHAGATPTPPIERRPEIPKHISDLVMEMLAKPRQLRPESVELIAERLRGKPRTPVIKTAGRRRTSRQASAIDRPTDSRARGSRRPPRGQGNNTAVGVLAGALVLVSLILLGVLFGASKRRQPSDVGSSSASSRSVDSSSSASASSSKASASSSKANASSSSSRGSSSGGASSGAVSSSAAALTALRSQIDAALAAKDTARARALIASYLTRAPEDWVMVEQSARLALDANDAREAGVRLVHLFNNRKQMAWTAPTLANLLVKSNRHDDAARVLQMALKLGATPNLHLATARLLLSRERLLEAAEALDDPRVKELEAAQPLIETTKRKFMAAHDLAKPKAFEEMEQMQRAARAFLSLRPGSLYANVMQAVIDQRGGRHREAVTRVDRLLEALGTRSHPQRWLMHYVRSTSLVLLDTRLETSVADSNYALRVIPSTNHYWPRIIQFRAHGYSRMKQPRLAAATMLMARRLLGAEHAVVASLWRTLPTHGRVAQLMPEDELRKAYRLQIAPLGSTAAIKAGDRIQAVAGERVAQGDEVETIARAVAAGQPIKLTVRRASTKQTFEREFKAEDLRGVKLVYLLTPGLN